MSRRRPGSRPLLVPVMQDGRRLAPAEPVAAASQRCASGLRALPPGALALHNPAAVSVTVSPALARLRDDLQDRLRRDSTG